MATLELWDAGRPGASAPKYALMQLKGPCNAKPPAAVAAAVVAFVDKANAIVLSRSREPVEVDGAYGSVDVRLVQARQRIHLLCLARIAGQGAGASPR